MANISQRTPRGISFPNIPPVRRCEDSALELAKTLKALIGRCDDDFQFTNPSAIQKLAYIRKQALGAYYLASERHKATKDSPQVLTELQDSSATEPAARLLEGMLVSLADSFDRENKKLEDWVETFKPHLRAAQRLNRLLGRQAEEAIKDLDRDLTSLTAIVESIASADDNFASTWVNTLESLRVAWRSYSTILTEHWNQKQWHEIPVFPQSHLDEQSLLHCHKPMETIGRNWASKMIEANGQDFRVAVSELKAVISNLDLPLTKSRLQNVHLPTGTLATFSEIKRDLQTDAKSLPIRICCFGTVKHGKSGMINSLIGKVVLESGTLSTTAWPVVVKHVVGKVDPVLRIDPDHFSPYLSFLRDGEFAQKYKSKSLLKLLKPQEAEWLRFFESKTENYAFPTLCTDPGKVRDTIIKINNLMRICWRFSTSATFPTLENTTFPIIEIEFQALRGEKMDFQILDLPGLDDQTKSAEPGANALPEHIMDQACATGVQACVYIVKQKDISATRIPDAVKRAKALTNQEPVIAVYGTHAEARGDVREALHEVCSAVWGTQMAASRVEWGAPGLHVSADETLRCSYEGDGSTMELKKLDDIYANPGCRTVVDYILTLPPNDGGREIFEKTVNAQTWKQDLEKVKAKAFQEKLERHFHRHVIEDCKDRLSFHILRRARHKLLQLIATQGDLTSRALASLNGETDSILQGVMDFKEHSKKILAQWDPEATPLVDPLQKSIEAEVNVLRTNAINRVVGREVETQIIREGRLLKNRKQAFIFVSASEGRVKAALQRVVTDFVSAMRRAAKAAWEGRLQNISNMLTNNQLAAPFLQMEIAEALSADAVSFAEAIREDALKSLEDLAKKELAGARQEDASLEQRIGPTWDSIMAQKNMISYQVAQAKISETPLDLQLKDDIRLVVEAVNEVGFSMRPAVSGEAGIPQLKDSHWPILDEDFGGNGLFVVPSELQTWLESSIVNPWFKVLEQESKATIMGAITKAGKVAVRLVNTVIEQRIRELEDHLKAPSPTTPRDLVDMKLVNALVIARAQCSLLYGAVDELYVQWGSKLAVILSEGDRPVKFEDDEDDDDDFGDSWN